MKPFHQGKQAFYKGEIGNPYSVGTTKYRNWELGFNRGYFDNLARVKKREQQQHDRKEIGTGSGRV